MSQRLLIFTVLFCCSTAAAADQDYSWCRGFVIKALGELPVEGLSRVELWLDWNEIADLTAADSAINPERYQAGRDQFSRLNAVGDTRGIIKTAEQDCAVGSNSGWLLW